MIHFTSLFSTVHSINVDISDCVGCPDDVTAAGLGEITTTKLRNIELSDSKGVSFTLGSKIGNDKSVVVFLRHLA